MSQQPNGIHHIAIMCGDIRKHIAFFSEVVGFPLVALFDMHGVPGGLHAFLRMNDFGYFSLVQLPDVDRIPIELGEVKQLTQLFEPATGLSWLGADRVGVLVDPNSPRLLTQMVGGPGSAEAAPSNAISIAGARTASGVRILGANGELFAHAGSAWREVASGVSVLATRVGE